MKFILMFLITAINWDLILGEGMIITFVGYLIVFVSLLLLYLVFKFIPKVLHMYTLRQLRRKGDTRNLEAEDLEISGEVNAAISAAIFLYFEQMHDAEDPVITIKRISKNYTPWSSKIYGVTRGLNRRF